jgi:hypothetical protein
LSCRFAMVPMCMGTPPSSRYNERTLRGNLPAPRFALIRVIVGDEPDDPPRAVRLQAKHVDAVFM